MKRHVVVVLAKLDEAVDELLYRPAVVKATTWLPRWWRCDLAKLSMRLDESWSTEYWIHLGGPGALCAACRRRAAWMTLGGIEPGEQPTGDYLEGHPIDVCGWCRFPGPMFITDEADLQRALDRARTDSVSWRWRRASPADRGAL
jgi:hypothetical protein